MWLSGKESACQCEMCKLDLWVRKIPWRRKWQPIPLFLPGKCHGQRGLMGYSPWGYKRVGTTLVTKQHNYTHVLSFLINYKLIEVMIKLITFECLVSRIVPCK